MESGQFNTLSLRYPVGIESFSEIREGGYVYVDKTAYIPMLEQKGKYYFISRPRRFGKSVFISTMEAYFQGRKELFEGLAIDTEHRDWAPRPVFRFTFNKMDTNSEEDLTSLLDKTFSDLEAIYGKETDEDRFPQRFDGLLRRAVEQTGRKVAILIDEYDSPLLSTLEKPKLNERYREILKSIFVILKSGDPYIHMAFITGVSRFSHTSLFSGANNIPDWSLREETAAICGITADEMKRYFAPGIKDFADEWEISHNEAEDKLRQNYDGYHFTPKCPDIYNPYSLLQALQAREIGEYWFGSGSPTFLIKALRSSGFQLPRLDCVEAKTSTLTSKESYLQNPVSLLFETGYLTIKDYDRDLQIYTLGIPNIEVGKGLAGALLPIYSCRHIQDVDSWIIRIQRAMAKGDAKLFMELLQEFLEGNPYSNTELNKRETYFKNNIFLVFKFLGFKHDAERQTCSARSDIVLETRGWIYVFELKVDSTPEDAMRQIDAKGYVRPYLHDGRPIIKIGANYSSKTNNIDGWDIQKVETQRRD